jgi:hypothetical protein
MPGVHAVCRGPGKRGILRLAARKYKKLKSALLSEMVLKVIKTIPLESRMPPIATYADKSYFGKREYTLFQDRITVRFKSWSSDGEATLRLKDLKPEFSKQAVRTKIFSAGLWVLGGAAIVHGILKDLVKSPPIPSGLFLVWALSGLVCMIIGFRKLHLVTFASDAGVEVLTIVNAGSRKNDRI